ncbi:MAG: MFS transporter, partial [Pseudomonadales bacterium]
YGLSGSVTAFLAPLLVAVVTDISQSQRIGFASLVILILIGGLMLGWVREEQATRAPD